MSRFLYQPTCRTLVLFFLLSEILSGKKPNPKSCPNPQTQRPAIKNYPKLLVHNTSYKTAYLSGINEMFSAVSYSLALYTVATQSYAPQPTPSHTTGTLKNPTSNHTPIFFKEPFASPITNGKGVF